jgi:uncharacterized membrane protein
MASAATGVFARWPRRGVLLALLVVSLVLNVFFVAGAVWTRVRTPPAHGLEQRFQRLAADLDLDARQRGAFERYVAAIRARNEKMHQEVAPLIGGAWEEIAKPQADTAEVLRRFDTAIEKRRGFQHEVVVQTLDFLSILTAEQRSKFVAIARDRRGGRRAQSR